MVLARFPPTAFDHALAALLKRIQAEASQGSIVILWPSRVSRLTK